MRAAVYYRYGNATNIKIKEIDHPLPKDNELLIKVHAASVNSWDVDLLTGKPRMFRFWGLFKPRYILQAVFLGKFLSAVTKKNIKILAAEPNWRLSKLASKVSYGKITPVVDKVFPLEDVGEAMATYVMGKLKEK